MSEKDNICTFCGLECSHISGDPGEWAIYFSDPDNTGIARPHHEKCLYMRLEIARLNTNTEDVCKMQLDFIKERKRFYNKIHKLKSKIKKLRLLIKP